MERECELTTKSETLEEICGNLRRRLPNISEAEFTFVSEQVWNRVRQARQRARPLEENGAKILKENLSPFSEEDACSALGAGLERECELTTKK
ncbi:MULTISPECIES: hypothetical protein [Aerococcus]|uniref:Uncharacterized protein n=1 Tax=Aerococcus tenax TaxID=3078812 RepID=A0A5N1BQL5_9LACT|nr:hypothetical protein [Aerococcus urinae]KAA9240632.1 hypothetical protein F6I34_04480 [Aerococcus urinae]MDK7303209.1 hypothetical protein [Aerococcus urinae]MDK7802185.1 hypothetical protein [Aerococcus urinae]MDK8655771.1 hypothetical protein [Aerococcus urinae]